MSCQHGLFEISFACTYVWQALSQFSSVLIQLYYKPEEKLVDLLRVRRYIDLLAMHFGQCSYMFNLKLLTML